MCVLAAFKLNVLNGICVYAMVQCITCMYGPKCMRAAHHTHTHTRKGARARTNTQYYGIMK